MSSTHTSRFRRLLHLRRRDQLPEPRQDGSTSMIATVPPALDSGSALIRPTPPLVKEGVNSIQPVLNEADFYGLRVVAQGINPVVDIVAVHGLNGHRDRTWTAGNGVHWLRDLLPSDIPQARIFCWGYDANTRAESRVSCQYLYGHARTLVSDLCRTRTLTDSTERPIVFVAYSLGGLVVKSALIHSDAARQGALEEHRSVKVSTYGIFFMGTPHQGANGVELGRVLVNIASLFVPSNDRILRHLERDSEWLQQQLGQYNPISGDFVTKFAYEEYQTKTALGTSIMVVPQASAIVPGQADAEPIVIHADHRDMVKYVSMGDSGYVAVSQHLQIMCKAAPREIQLRWEAVRRVDRARLGDAGTAFSVSFSLFEVAEVDYFVARNEELDQIHSFLKDHGRSRKTIVIHGLGGMGKTQLAAEYAKRHRENYTAIFWVNAKDDTSLKCSYSRIARRILQEHPSLVSIRSSVESGDLDRMAKAVRQWMDTPGNGRWLMIYDNYDEPAFGEIEASGVGSPFRGYDIRNFFPETHHGAIIITTRSARVKIGRRIPLGKLEEIEDCLQILSHASNRQNLSKDPGAIELAKRLDGLPLALATAGAYLDNVVTTFSEYLQMYQQSWLSIQKTTPGLLTYEEQAMYSTWNISYTHVKRRSPESAMLLRLWAYLDNEDLWFELLHDRRELPKNDCEFRSYMLSDSMQWFWHLTDDLFGFDRAIRVLYDYGLVEMRASAGEQLGTGSRGYSMHHCVHAWTIHVLNEERDPNLAWLALDCVSSGIPQKEDTLYWPVHQRLIHHASRCHVAVVQGGVPVVEDQEWALHELGRLFHNQCWFGDSEAAYSHALESYELSRGPDHALTLDTVNNLGSLYWSQGRLQEAEKMYNRALHGREKTLGPDHEQTLDTLNNLGNLYQQQGRLNESIEVYKRAIKGYKTSSASNSPPMHAFKTLGNLGVVYAAQGRLEDAEEMYERAMRGKEKILGSDNVSTLHTVTNLAIIYKKQGRLTDAEAMYRRALDRFEKALGPEHLTTLNVVNNLAVLCEQRRPIEAEVLYQRVLRGREEALGPEHVSTLEAVHNLGDLRESQGLLLEAQNMYERAHRGYERALSEDEKKTYIPALRTMDRLASVYAKQGRHKESRDLFLRCKAGYEVVYSVDHQRYLDVVEALARLASVSQTGPTGELDIVDARLIDWSN